MRSGQDYPLLRPTYSIWLLAENLLRDAAGYAHVYKLRDERGRPLLDNGGIYLLELEKFRVKIVETESQRWLKFFKDAEALDETALPEWMNTPEMRKAMNTLKQFSEKEKDYHAYQARQNYLREQCTIR